MKQNKFTLLEVLVALVILTRGIAGLLWQLSIAANRAARNAEGTVIMYADQETAAMHAAILETNRRRAKQAAYNQAHGIVPKTIVKGVRELLEISGDVEAPKRADGVKMTEAERRAEIARLEAQMKKAAEMLEYEYAAVLRDRLIELRGQ